MRNTLLCLTACLLLAALCTTAFAAPPRYSITVLDLPSADFSSFEVTGFNNHGQVVGYGRNGTDDDFYGFLWNGSARTLIAQSAYYNEMPNGINNHGQVPIGGYRMWQSGQITDIPGRPAHPYNSLDIDDYGRVVGSAFDGRVDGISGSAFISDPVNGAQLLTNLDAMYGKATAISSTAGYVCGEFRQSQSAGHAFVWRDGVMTDLDPWDTWSDNGTYANDVNDSGWVAGIIWGDELHNAALWRGTERTDLDVPGCSASWGYGVNNLGQVVGSASYQEEHPFGHECPFIWQDGIAYNLNDYIPWSAEVGMVRAYDINDQGQIAGTGIHNGVRCGILLTPVVPEPSSLLALAGGLAAIGGMIRRRK